MMKILVAMALAGFSSLAAAQNWVGLLKNSPAESFDDEDLQLFLATGRKALNEGKDNETLRWENPKTRARGEVTVTSSYKWKSYGCKELRVYSEAGGRKGTSTFNLCSVEGKWRLLAPSQVNQAKKAS
jgi:surface antigen